MDQKTMKEILAQMPEQFRKDLTELLQSPAQSEPLEQALTSRNQYLRRIAEAAEKIAEALTKMVGKM